MSNTKWHTVFEILECVSLNVRQVIVKFSENPNPIAMHLPWLPAEPHAYIDSMAFGPFPLISIEWLEVPAVALFPRANHLPAQKIVQDIAAVESALLSSGKKFPLETSPTGLRIIGHAHPAAQRPLNPTIFNRV